MLSVITTEQATSELRLDLDQLVREGARRMLAAALEAEVDAYLAAHLAEPGSDPPRPPPGRLTEPFGSPGMWTRRGPRSSVPIQGPTAVPRLIDGWSDTGAKSHSSPAP